MGAHIFQIGNTKRHALINMKTFQLTLHILYIKSKKTSIYLKFFLQFSKIFTLLDFWERKKKIYKIVIFLCIKKFIPTFVDQRKNVDQRKKWSSKKQISIKWKRNFSWSAEILFFHFLECFLQKRFSPHGIFFTPCRTWTHDIRFWKPAFYQLN